MKRIIPFVTVVMLLSACSNSGNKTQKGADQTKQDQVEIANDLESALNYVPSWQNEDHVISMIEPPAHSGTFACILNDTLQYGYTFSELLKNINDGVPNKATYSGWVYTPVANPKLSIICSVLEDGKQVNWKAVPLDDELSTAGSWVEFSANFFFDKSLTPNQEIRFYAWNQGKGNIFIDDIKIDLEYK
jgi:hypothetical protein